MKPFNLAEAKIAERNFYKQLITKKLKIIIMLVCTTIVISGICYSFRTKMSGNSTNLKSQLADIQGRCIGIKKELGTIKTKSGQREWQKQLTNGSSQCIGTLGCVLKNVPEDVWLDKVESSAQNSSIMVTGHSMSYESLYDFLTRLKASKQFIEVRINNSQATSSKSISYIDFELQAKLKGPGVIKQQAQPTQPAGVPAVQEST